LGEAPADLADACASFNHCVADTLRIKTERALAREPNIRALLVAGGVAANRMIRETMAGVASRKGLRLHLPSPARCTDNGAMIAYAGGVLAAEGFYHGLEVDAIPRGRKVPWDYSSCSMC
jgi:N6-L-threonylcarbamoyladenine synthase